MNRTICKQTSHALAVIDRTAARLLRTDAVQTGAAEWLLDNRYLLRREGNTARAALARTKHLPSRPFDLAKTLIREATAPLTPESIDLFLSAAQAENPLAEEELWAFPPLITAAIVCAVAETNASDRMAILITSLRMLSQTDLTLMLQSQSALELALRRDPTYLDEDEETRAARRAEICKAAKGNPAVSRSPSASPTRRSAKFLYFLSFAVLSVAPCLAIWGATGCVWASVLMLLPMSGAAKTLVDAVATRVVSMRHVPRLALKNGIPQDGKTLVVWSLLLTDPAGVKPALQEIRAAARRNRDAGAHLHFGLLVDLPDNPVQSAPQDDAIFDALREQVGADVFLFARPRVFQSNDKKYMGHERKRGAILDLCRLLRRKSTLLSVDKSKALPADIRYVIALDADTNLTPGAAKKMVASMMHPKNRPVVDPERKVVTQGYGLLAPRMATELGAAGKTLFTRVFAGQGGLDPYAAMAGEVYHDLFDKANFAGKGIFDVDVFLDCLDERFPENRILSHDMLEGCILGAGLLGDVELADGYPATFLSWTRRLHRWTRGDWQVAAWSTSVVPDHLGKPVKNPLGNIDRFKFFDNIRRSLLVPFTLAAMTAGILIPHHLWVFGLGLLTMLSHLIIEGVLSLFRKQTTARTHAGIITGFRAVLWQTVLLLLFLPYQSFIALHAMVIALWRLHVSGKNRLEWVTAAQIENGTEVQSLFRTMMPAVLWGALTAVCAASPVGWILGAAWACSPFAAQRVSRPKPTAPPLSAADQKFLRTHAETIWRYFDDFLTPADHFLIPDNWQEQPAVGLARRSSPTNIGLSTLCVLSAVDLGLCTQSRALDLLDGVLTTVEQLPKWHGHLDNWIDTRTLKTLPPRCVSTVDSGNFCGYLITLAQGLREWDDPAATALADRAKALADAMDFAPLYDDRRKLFRISVSPDHPEEPGGLYDLLASEARQTSYIAVARGEAEKKHWQRLGRAQTALGRFRGMASWTGTMFEYFMPHLILPVPDNSLLRESLDFCVYAHREQARRRGGAWGVSESCFYAFDPALNYQYKAHGIPALAFKRGLGKDRVIAPYASFLTLQTHPHASVRNLKRLGKLNLGGRYGLCEAADFTPTRISSGTMEAVRCYMSHHLGMSLVAVNNTLRGNIMQTRFMRDPDMGAWQCLLEERVPVGGEAIKPFGKEVPDKPHRRAESGAVRECTDMTHPMFTVLGNATYTLLCAQDGRGQATCRGNALTTREGIGLWLTLDNQQPLFLSADPSATPSAVFAPGRAVWRCQKDGIAAKVSVVVPENETAEFRTIKLKNNGKTAVNGILALYFDPVLQREEDYAAHPAFSKLFVETQIDENAVLIHRRGRTVGDDHWLCFAAHAPSIGYDTSRELALGRSGLSRDALTAPAGNTAGAVLDPCVLGKVPVSIAAGETISLHFTLAYATTADDAKSTAERLLVTPPVKPVTARSERIARLLNLTADETNEILGWLPSIVTRASKPLSVDPAALALGVPGLWAMGISGDFPLLLCPDGMEFPRLAKIIAGHQYLARQGAAFDLVILHNDGGEYDQPCKNFVRETLKSLQAEGILGGRAGVHLVDTTMRSSAEVDLLRGMARMIFGEPPQPIRIEPRNIGGGQRATTANTLPETAWCADGAFRFDTTAGLPPLAWSHVLANRGGFGALITDAGTGFLFHRNARENKLTPWTNDPLAVRGGLEMEVEIDGLVCSPFAPGAVVTYGFGYARWETQTPKGRLTLTQFVPADRMALVSVLSVDNHLGATLRVRAKILLGDSEAMSRTVSFRAHNAQCILAENPLNTAFAPQTLVAAGSQKLLQTAENAGILAVSMPFSSNTEVFVLGRAANAPGIALLQTLTDFAVQKEAFDRTCAMWQSLCRDPSLQPRDPKDADIMRYLGGFALFQVIACRMFARTSLYQCGGAYGFRDQLQDSLAALHADPTLTRTQILRAAARQYSAGDVMHWWHPMGRGVDKGVRTHCSDDLLWLPYAICEYLRVTRDTAFLAQSVPFLDTEPLQPGEHDRYEAAQLSTDTASVFEHGARALSCVLGRGTGARGLLLIGTGDWNDGMDLVGADGKGESVWLTWFCAIALKTWAELCESLPQTSALLSDALADFRNPAFLRREADILIHAAEAAWDGEWFLRGTYDDGATLGSANDRECQIDSISQSFAAWALSLDQSDPHRVERVKTALHAAVRRLVDPRTRVVKLLDPAFTGASGHNPGYIRGYLAGVRENGGQYTHAAVWLAMGLHHAGETEAAKEILRLLIPESHDPAVYKVEPYALAADVYAHPDHIGRGGWSLYTGAASWYYRVAKEVFSPKDESVVG